MSELTKYSEFYTIKEIMAACLGLYYNYIKMSKLSTATFIPFNYFVSELMSAINYILLVL